MSDKSTYFFGKNFTVFLTNDRRKLVAENYETAFGTDEDMKPADAFITLFEAACANNQKAIDRKSLEELSQKVPGLESQLQEKDEQIKRLENKVTQILTLHDEKVAELQATIDRLTSNDTVLSDLREEIDGKVLVIQERDKIIENLHAEIASLREAGSHDGGVVVMLKPNELKIIQEICKEESARTGKPVTPEILFKNVFFFVLINGPHDMFAAPIAMRKIQELSKTS